MSTMENSTLLLMLRQNHCMKNFHILQNQKELLNIYVFKKYFKAERISF